MLDNFDGGWRLLPGNSKISTSRRGTGLDNKRLDPPVSSYFRIVTHVSLKVEFATWPSRNLEAWAGAPRPRHVTFALSPLCFPLCSGILRLWIGFECGLCIACEIWRSTVKKWSLKLELSPEATEARSVYAQRAKLLLISRPAEQFSMRLKFHVYMRWENCYTGTNNLMWQRRHIIKKFTIYLRHNMVRLWWWQVDQETSKSLTAIPRVNCRIYTGDAVHLDVSSF